MSFYEDLKARESPVSSLLHYITTMAALVLTLALSNITVFCKTASSLFFQSSG